MLITRPSFADETARAVQARGFLPIIAPLLTVEHVAVAIPPGVQAIVVTSGNALPALAASALPLFAVGDATALRARQLGFATVSSASGDAATLAVHISATLQPAAGALLLVSGEGQGEALCADLAARGFAVHRRVGYAARAVAAFPDAAADALQGGALHAALFLSAATAAAFVGLLPPALAPCLAQVSALAIGRSTAQALEPLPWLRVCRARTPTLDDVLAHL